MNRISHNSRGNSDGSDVPHNSKPNLATQEACEAIRAYTEALRYQQEVEADDRSPVVTLNAAGERRGEAQYRAIQAIRRAAGVDGSAGVECDGRLYLAVAGDCMNDLPDGWNTADFTMIVSVEMRALALAA